MTTFIVAYILRLVTLPPLEASLVGAALAGYPEFGPELVEICKREAPGHGCDRTVGLHSNNRANDVQIAYDKAISPRYMYLRPGDCVYHRAPPSEFGVRGVHGLMAAYSLHYLGSCVSPAVLDMPLFSAIAATRRAAMACARSGDCSKAGRRTMWVGRDLEQARHTIGKKVRFH